MRNQIILPDGALDLAAVESELADSAAMWISNDPTRICDNAILMTATVLLRDPPESWDVPKAVVRQYEAEVKRRHLWSEMRQLERQIGNHDPDARTNVVVTPDGRLEQREVDPFPDVEDADPNDTDIVPPDGVWFE